MSLYSQDRSLAARVEEVCLNAWPALQEIHYDGWLIRLADGQTRRTNSVNVLRDGVLPVAKKIAHCEDVYRDHSLTPCFRLLSTANRELDDTLEARGYRAEAETSTLYMSFAEHPPQAPTLPVELTPVSPSAAWLSARMRFEGQATSERAKIEKILQQLALPATFAALHDASGEICSVAKGALHDRIVCLNMVATDPAQRRRGASRACVSAILQWAQERGAVGACLQVVSSNWPAIGLYRSLGFVHELYRYHYRTPAD